METADESSAGSRTLRILHVISSVDPAHGGPIEGVKQLGTVNKTAGHVVEVASLDHSNEPFVREFPLPLYTFGRSYLHYRYNPRLVPWLRSNRARYDAVVVNGIWQYNSFAVWRALHGTDTPYFVYPHGMLDPWFKHTYPLKHIKKLLYWPLGQYRTLRDARAVLFTCDEERRLARQSFGLYRCAEVPVNYGTASPPGDPAQQRQAFFAKFKELQGRRLITFLGRIHVKKGCDLLLEAFAKTRHEGGPVAAAGLHLVMAGPDQAAWTVRLQEMAARLGVAEQVSWVGMVQGDLKWGLLHASEVFILPSHQENFGIAVAEALACHLPALISDKVNIWREITHDAAGFAENDDLEGTVKLLRRWLRLPETEREQMRQNARKCFLARFEIQQAARSLVRVINQSLISAHG
jgi:glycosyltransferase involved in cell wall biosynthesis